MVFAAFVSCVFCNFRIFGIFCVFSYFRINLASHHFWRPVSDRLWQSCAAPFLFPPSEGGILVFIVQYGIVSRAFSRSRSHRPQTPSIPLISRYFRDTPSDPLPLLFDNLVLSYDQIPVILLTKCLTKPKVRSHCEIIPGPPPSP